jgi:hypothetical protein
MRGIVLRIEAHRFGRPERNRLAIAAAWGALGTIVPTSKVASLLAFLAYAWAQ